MKKATIAILAVAAVSAFAVKPAQAATAVQPSASYAAGWNMVGGPFGTNFGAAAAFLAYGPSGYVPVDRTSSGCPGYWAYFLEPRTVLLAQQTATTDTCPLMQGWNLVGDPFDTEANLPAGTSAYFWDTGTLTYDSVTFIPPGASVWIFSAAASYVTLTTPVPTLPAPPQPTLVISSESGPGPYSLHVGDTVELVTPYNTPYTATADSRFLSLQSAGSLGELTCIGEPACEFSFTKRFWLWKAVAPGSTAIVLNPMCLSSSPPCALPSKVFDIAISP